MGLGLGKNYPLTKARSVQAYDSSSGVIIWFPKYVPLIENDNVHYEILKLT